MSDAGEIDIRDLAQLVQTMREGQSGPVEVAGANIAFVIWDSLGKEETEPDFTKGEARELLNELPTSWEEERDEN